MVEATRTVASSAPRTSRLVNCAKTSCVASGDSTVRVLTVIPDESIGSAAALASGEFTSGQGTPLPTWPGVNMCSLSRPAPAMLYESQVVLVSSRVSEIIAPQVTAPMGSDPKPFAVKADTRLTKLVLSELDFQYV